MAGFLDGKGLHGRSPGIETGDGSNNSSSKSCRLIWPWTGRQLGNCGCWQSWGWTREFGEVTERQFESVWGALQTLNADGMPVSGWGKTAKGFRTGKGCLSQKS